MTSFKMLYLGCWGLFTAWVGFTSPLVIPQSRLQQLWLCQAIAHWWIRKFGSPSRKSSDSFTSQLVSMHESEEAHIVSPPYIGLAPRTSGGRPNNASSPFRACCDHVCPPIPLISQRNGSLQLFDRDASIAPLLQANTPPRQTSRCSSWVDAGLFGALVGFTSPLVVPPSLPQQLWACQTNAHWWIRKFG